MRGRSPLDSFNHVIDPHFVTFSSSLYTTVRNPDPTVITDPQIEIRKKCHYSDPHFVAYPLYYLVRSHRAQISAINTRPTNIHYAIRPVE